MFLLSLLALAAVMFASLSLGSSSIGATDVAAFVAGNASDMAKNVLANVRAARAGACLPVLRLPRRARSFRQRSITRWPAQTSSASMPGPVCSFCCSPAWLRMHWAYRRQRRF